MRPTAIYLGLVFSLLASSALAAEGQKLSLADKKQKKAVTSQLSYYTDSLKEKCGLEVEVDWGSFIKAKRFDGPGSTVASACQPAIQAAAWGCQGDKDFKEALAGVAQSIRCVHVDSREKTGLKIDAAKKQVIFTVLITDTGAGSKPTSMFVLDHTRAKAWFDKNL